MERDVEKHTLTCRHVVHAIEVRFTAGIFGIMEELSEHMLCGHEEA